MSDTQNPNSGRPDQGAIKSFYDSKADVGLTAREVAGEKQLQYGEMLDQGLERAVLPLPPWENRGRGTEDILVRDIGRHIASRVEQAFGAGSFYTGASPDQVLAHYRGVIEGLGLADPTSLKGIDKLQKGLASVGDQREYFEREIKPFSLALRPAKR